MNVFIRQFSLFLIVAFIRNGSIIAGLQATFLNHPDAECIFTEAFNRLDLEALFPGAGADPITCKLTNRNFETKSKQAASYLQFMPC